MLKQEIVVNKIVRSRRKTIALVVTPEAGLIVRAPWHTPLVTIQTLIEKKSDWIRRKLREVSPLHGRATKEFVSGEEFYYLGNKYPLSIARHAAVEIELNGNFVLAERALPEARAAFERWYKAESLKKISERCAWYASRTGYKPTSVTITNARKRWGSCGARGTLNFSWRLIMAPPDVIDYVVVHELVHIGQMDHSKLFWHKVRNILPDYARQRKWLRENDRLLTL